MSTPGSDTFGNYMLHDLADTGRSFHEIQLPEPVSWWPSTPGWTAVAVVAAAWGGYKLYGCLRRWWQNRYRREALQRLEQLSQMTPNLFARQLPVLLRAVALHAHPRREIAALGGRDWLSFLEQSTPGFDSELGQRWLNAQYQPLERCGLTEQDRAQLYSLAADWIRNHQPGTEVPGSLERAA